MKFQPFRGAVVVASVMVASVTASQALAEIDVLTGLTANGFIGGTLVSTYTFNQAMVLNSIGFVSEGLALTTISYTLGSETTPLLESNLSAVDANGLRWYSLAGGGLSVNASSVLNVSTAGVFVPANLKPAISAYYRTRVRRLSSTDTTSNVTYNGLIASGSTFVFTTNTNSNLRVSNPSSNVAPEPDSFALALTGGAALLGICIRRRRNAGLVS